MRDFDPMLGLTSSLPLAQRAVERREGQTVCIDLKAHNALSPKGVKIFLATVSIGPIITGSYCLMLGLWPVLPFAGLEFLLVCWALRSSLKWGKQRQSISISHEFVTISSQLSVLQQKTSFPRHWTRVKLRGPSISDYPTRLFFESRGQVCEVGCFLTESERRQLAVRLRQLVGNMNESPALN